MCLERMTIQMTRYMYIVIKGRQGNSLLIFLKEWIEDLIRIYKISFLYLIIYSTQIKKSTKKDIQILSTNKICISASKIIQAYFMSRRWLWLQRQTAINNSIFKCDQEIGQATVSK